MSIFEITCSLYTMDTEWPDKIRNLGASEQYISHSPCLFLSLFISDRQLGYLVLKITFHSNFCLLWLFIIVFFSIVYNWSVRCSFLHIWWRYTVCSCAIIYQGDRVPLQREATERHVEAAPEGLQGGPRQDAGKSWCKFTSRMTTRWHARTLLDLED